MVLRLLCHVAMATLTLVPTLVMAQIQWIEAPEFAPPWTGHIPEFGDLDGDGDFDMIYAVVLQSYRNVGSVFAPSWQQDDSLVAGVEYVSRMTTCLSDLDEDGDLDMSVGQMYGEVYSVLYYRNSGTAADPIWQQQNSMYESLPLRGYTHPELADLDADGDLDLVVSSYVHFEAYRNTGTPHEPIWSPDPSLIDGLVPPYWQADHNFGDIDGDGDLDAVLGSRDGDVPVTCFENVGTPQVPAWAENASMLTGVDRFIEGLGLDLADLDGDGDLDLLSKAAGEAPVVYLNCGPITSVVVSSWGRIKSLFR